MDVPDPMGISALQKAGRSAFELEEVKVTFKKEIKTSISGVEIEGREGDMRNLPRWVARALEGDGYASVEEPDMESALKQAMSKENAQDDFQLATLGDHFYIHLQEYAKRAPQQKRDDIHSMLNTLVRSRIGKISRLFISSELNAENASRMTVEEREYYAELRRSYNEFVSHVMGEQE